MKSTVVRPSPIDGKGLFACRDFQKGEVVEPIEGEVVLRESESKFALPMSGRRSFILLNKVKYVNSSNANPNVSFNLKKLQLVAIRDIQCGEELVSVYGSVFR